jgi:hypothetical protein
MLRPEFAQVQKQALSVVNVHPRGAFVAFLGSLEKFVVQIYQFVKTEAFEDFIARV